MGAKEIREQLDTEIQELERAIYGEPPLPKEPAESVAADQSAQGSESGKENVPPTAIGTDVSTGQSENNFDVNQQISHEPQDNAGQEEPASSQKGSWKNRFVKLKQHHDAEMFKQRKQIGSLLDQINLYEQEVGRLNKVVGELTRGTPKSVKDFATQQEIDAIGEEELSMVDRLTRQAVEEATKELRSKVEAAEARERQQRQAQAETVKASAYNIFLKRLGAVVPDFAEIDVDPRFEQWLNLNDPISGFVRKDLFKQAEAVGDVGRVAGFFQDFKKAVTPRQTLDSKVTPVGSSATAQPTMKNNQEPEMVSVADYEQFMDDVTRGRFKGREQERQKWDAYFEKALAEGRIR